MKIWIEKASTNADGFVGYFVSENDPGYGEGVEVDMFFWNAYKISAKRLADMQHTLAVKAGFEDE